MISKEDRRILNALASRVRSRFPAAGIWAFGSRARGKSSWDSDFDVCIVLPELNSEIDRWVRDLTWEIGFENDCVITTVVMDERQFRHGPMSESTLVVNILREDVPA